MVKTGGDKIELKLGFIPQKRPKRPETDQSGIDASNHQILALYQYKTNNNLQSQN